MNFSSIDFFHHFSASYRVLTAAGRVDQDEVAAIETAPSGLILPPNMTARASFRQDDLAKAIKAVQNAGLGIACVKVSPDGRWFAIEIGSTKTIRRSNPNPWDLEFDQE